MHMEESHVICFPTCLFSFSSSCCQINLNCLNRQFHCHFSCYKAKRLPPSPIAHIHKTHKFLKQQLAMGGGEQVEIDVDVSLKDLSSKLEEFAKARNWEKYHSPRNLLLAMVILFPLSYFKFQDFFFLF